jgi:hypothetical protein
MASNWLMRAVLETFEGASPNLVAKAVMASLLIVSNLGRWGGALGSCLDEVIEGVSVVVRLVGTKEEFFRAGAETSWCELPRTRSGETVEEATSRVSTTV